MYRVKFVAAIAAGIALTTTPLAVQAATLTGSAAALTPGTNFNLTALGTTDWFKTEGVESIILDGSGTGFSDIGGLADGFDNPQPTSVSFSYTNGPSEIPVGTDLTGSIGDFAEFDHTNPLSVTINTTGTQEEAVIYGLQANANTLLTATLGNQTLMLTNPNDATGAGTLSNPGVDYSETGYTLDFQSDTPGQPLNITLTCTFDQGGFTGLMAGTLVAAPVPEPASIGTIGLMGTLLLRRRRRIFN